MIVNTYTCPGGKELRALSLVALVAKIELHKVLDHLEGEETACARPMQPVAPLVRAYRHEAAKGVTT